MRIDLWCAAASAGPPGPLERWCGDWLNRDESARADRLRQRTSRNQFIVGRGMCRALIARRAAVSPAAVEFRFTAHGKPEVAAPREALVQFNLAHTDRLVVCGLAGPTPIGVDVERLDRTVNLQLAERYFARSEADWVASLSQDHQPEAFLRVWTLKEAFIKALGTGLATPLDRFAFEDLDAPRPRLRLLDDALRRAVGDPGRWSFLSLRPDDAFIAAIALQCASPVDATVAHFNPLVAIPRTK